MILLHVDMIVELRYHVAPELKTVHAKFTVKNAVLMSCLIVIAKFQVTHKSWHIFINYAYIAYLCIYLTILVSVTDSRRIGRISSLDVWA